MSGEPSVGSVSMDRAAHPLATAVLALLTVATSVGLCRLFPDWEFLAPTIAVVVIGHLVAYLGRVLRIPAVLAVPIALVAVLGAVGVLFHGSTAVGGLFPSAETISALRSDLRLVLDQFTVAVAPVPSRGAFAAAAAAMVGVAGPLADTFAFRAYGRGEAVVPTLVVFVFCSALGADRHRLAVSALWIGAALLATAVLRVTHRRDHDAWVGGRLPRRWRPVVAAAVVGALCAGAAAAAAPHLPGAGERSLLDTRQRRKQTTEIVSPLVEIRAQMVNRSNTELFTVEADRPAYWRLMGLAAFDGQTWSPASESLRDGDGQLSSGGGQELRQSITIQGLAGKLVPVAFVARSVDTDLDLQWAGESQSLITPDDEPLSRGDTVAVVSRLAQPTAAELTGATSDSPPDRIFVTPTPGLPRAAREIGDEIAANNATPYARALALQNYFRDNFTYSLDVPRGHSNDAMRNFLEARIGYCEQFSGTFAAIARYIGLPARVAVGFTPGDLEDDGLYHVLGKYAHAWPEVWFDGVGWVAFEPTPGRGAPGNEDATGVAPEQDGETPPPPTEPPTEATVEPPDANPPEQQEPPPAATVPPLVAEEPPSTSPESWWWLWVVLGAGLVGAWVLLMPELVRARRKRRRGHSPVEQVSGAWHEAERALAMTGVAHDPGRPALAVVTDLADDRVDGAADLRVVAELADHVTRAMYSGVDPTPDVVARADQLAAEIRDECHRSLPWTKRLAARLDPRRVV